MEGKDVGRKGFELIERMGEEKNGFWLMGELGDVMERVVGKCLMGER